MRAALPLSPVKRGCCVNPPLIRLSATFSLGRRLGKSPHHRILRRSHGLGVSLLDVPLVQAGQAHGYTLAAEGHAAVQQRFAAGVESPRPGQRKPAVRR